MFSLRDSPSACSSGTDEDSFGWWIGVESHVRFLSFCISSIIYAFTSIYLLYFILKYFDHTVSIALLFLLLSYYKNTYKKWKIKKFNEVK